MLGLLGATETLTPREREVVRALLKGHAEAEIAELVGMTTRSAHQRIVGIYRKLGVRTQAELTALVLDGASGPTGT